MAALSEQEEFELLSLERERAITAPSGPSTMGGTTTEFGKGVVRGVSDVWLGAGKSALSALFGPVGGGVLSRGVETLAAPSREPFTAAPEGPAERYAGIAGEFAGAFAAPGAPGLAQRGISLASKAVSPVVAPVARTLRNLIDPLLPGGTERAVGRTLLKLAGEKRAGVISALAEPAQIVPGSFPTAAEAAAKAGSAEFSGAQRMLEQRRPTPYSDIASQQETARQGAIQSFGKTPQQLEKAIENRAKEAATLYGEAKKQIVAVDNSLKELFQRPSMEVAAKRAAQLAKEDGKAFMVSRETPEGLKQGLIVSESGIPFIQEVIPAKNAKMSVENLHYMKMAMDDLISNPERFGIGATEARAIASTKSDFIKWMSSKSEKYAQARAAFSKASEPINVMQVGQQLEKGLTAPLGATERPGPFATAMREAPRTMQKATGFPRFKNLEQAVGAENTAAAEAVLADLSRAAQQEKLARAGTGRATEIIKGAVPKVPASGMFSPIYSVFRAVFNRFGGKLTDNELDVLSKIMETPKATLKLMQQAAAREALTQQMRGQGGKIGGLSSRQRIAAGGAAVGVELEAQ